MKLKVINLKISVLLVILFGTLLVKCRTGDENQNQIIDGVRALFGRLPKIHDSNRNTDVSNRYDDEKCLEQINELTRAANATELWALKGSYSSYFIQNNQPINL